MDFCEKLFVRRSGNSREIIEIMENCREIKENKFFLEDFMAYQLLGICFNFFCTKLSD